MTLSHVIWTLVSLLSIIRASEDPKVNEQGIAGKRKHMSLKIPQKLDIIRWLGIGESWSVLLASYNIGLLTVYDTEK